MGGWLRDKPHSRLRYRYGLVLCRFRLLALFACAQWLVANNGSDANRTLLFTFMGGVHSGEYSGGARAVRSLVGLNKTC